MQRLRVLRLQFLFVPACLFESTPWLIAFLGAVPRPGRSNGLAARGYAAEISYEPVAPRLSPAAGGPYWRWWAPGWWSRPGAQRRRWHARAGPHLAARRVAVLLCAGSVLVYGAVFQWLGFVLATTLMACRWAGPLAARCGPVWSVAWAWAWACSFV